MVDRKPNMEKVLAGIATDVATGKLGRDEQTVSSSPAVKPTDQQTQQIAASQQAAADAIASIFGKEENTAGSTPVTPSTKK